MKRSQVESWVEEQLPGETLRAYVAGGPANGASLDDTDSLGSRHPAVLQAQVELRGLDGARRIGPGRTSICLALTDHRLAIASVGGAWRARPKELLHSYPRDAFTCEWWVNDQSERPTAAYRNWIFQFEDGRWLGIGTATKLLGKTVKTARLAEEFTEALGDRATEVDWRDSAPR